MKTVKKWIAFMLAAGLIISAVKVTEMTVLADAPEDYYQDKEEFDNNGGYANNGHVIEREDGATFTGMYDPLEYTDFEDDEVIYWNKVDANGNNIAVYQYIDGQWVPIGDCGSSSSDSDSESTSGGLTYEDIVAMQSQAAAEAEQHAASDEGFLEVADVYRAAEKNMSAGEYYNNVVISTPGIENAVTVGQGGNIVVNGVVTNMTAMISKVTNRAYVDSLRVSGPEGRILNVVGVSYPGFDATINFYMPSVTAEMDVVALQYSAGTWVDVDVAEVREDHVVLNMKNSGIVAFVAKETITE